MATRRVQVEQGLSQPGRARRVRLPPAAVIAKAPTGIRGFDGISGGGVPLGRTTLLVGGPGSGKTLFALQFLVHGARDDHVPGIFVAFEESARRVVANAATFGWQLADLKKKRLAFIDAHPAPDLVQSGDFDIGGLLAALEAQMRATKARRIVFDAIDVMLALLPDEASRRRELYRLHEWLLAHEVTAIVTLQSGADESRATVQQPFAFVQFMVDCVVILNHRVVQGVSHRDLRVLKYRGSGFDENASPFLIGASGLEVAIARSPGRAGVPVSGERVSSGVARLDTMLGGGYYRGASVLITGSPGTAKTTLSGIFAEAACARGERTMFVSFDSEPAEVVRNLASVGIRLDRYVKNKTLRMVSARLITGSEQTYLDRITTLAAEHDTRCLVIDPMSTWSRAGLELSAYGVAERLTDWAKAAGITLVCTRLLDEMPGPLAGGAPLHISALADTWIHLEYLVQAGERNRGLSVIKSRGTAHSNQVRELILGDAGVTLADAYTAGGEVLMGTLRWEKERAEHLATETAEASRTRRHLRLDAEAAELEEQLKSLQVQIDAKRAEMALLAHATHSGEENRSQGRSRMRELRGADSPTAGRKSGTA